MDRDAKLAALQTAVARHDSLALKGKAMRHTAVNGNMFAFLGQDDVLAFRFSDTDRKAFEDEHGPSEVRQYGSVMRGYVDLPDAVIASPGKLGALFDASVSYAETLKPKPSKK